MEHKAKKYRYAWMSFAENEQALLKEYLHQQALQGYEISKIARFYLRFKYVGQPQEPYDVQSYRSSYFGHLYWEYSQEALPPKKSYGSRFYFNLSLLLLTLLITIASLVYLWHFDIRLLYSDAALLTFLTLPVFSLSFFLDYLGRFWESCHYHQPAKHSLAFAKLRALFLGLNMIFRYMLLFVLIVPVYFRELQPVVVFILIAFAIYQLAYYYLPHRHPLKLVVIACLVAFAACLTMNRINEARPYQKKEIDYNHFEVLRLENMMDEPLLEGYARQIHRYSSTSLWVPLYYTRTEEMTPIHQKEPCFKTKSSFSYCRDESLALQLFWEKARQTVHDNSRLLDASLWHVDEILLIDKGHLIVLYQSLIMEFESSFDLTEPRMIAFLFDVIQNDLTEPLTN